MTQTNFNQCLTIVLHEEGGYTNNPQDPGGITNFGITKTNWEEYVGHPVSASDMQSLTVTMITPYYHSKVWNKLLCDQLPSGIDLCVFDFAVNGGPSRSAKFLQKIIGATQDGSIGPNTISLLNSYISKNSILDTINQFQNQRRVFYQSLPTFSVFGKGWLSRVDRIQNSAISMIR